MYSDGVKLGRQGGGVPIPPSLFARISFVFLFSMIVSKLFNHHKKPNQRFVEGFCFPQLSVPHL